MEVEKLRAKMTETEMKTVAGMNFCKGKLERKDVVIVRSGIGKVNAGICSQILVDLYQVDGIVNTGIAGSLRNEINIGDLVLSTVAVQHDVDAGGFGYPAGEIPQLGVKEFPADERLLALAEEACREAISALSRDALPAVISLSTARRKRTGSMTPSTRTAQRWKAQQSLRPHT